MLSTYSSIQSIFSKCLPGCLQKYLFLICLWISLAEMMQAQSVCLSKLMNYLHSIMFNRSVSFNQQYTSYYRTTSYSSQSMSDIYLMIILKTSMNVMVIMSVIKSVLILMDLLCVHVMMSICYKLMEELVKVRISDNGHTE